LEIRQILPTNKQSKLALLAGSFQYQQKSLRVSCQYHALPFHCRKTLPEKEITPLASVASRKRLAIAALLSLKPVFSADRQILIG